eukprot:gene755-36605_t
MAPRAGAGGIATPFVRASPKGDHTTPCSRKRRLREQQRRALEESERQRPEWEAAAGWTSAYSYPQAPPFSAHDANPEFPHNIAPLSPHAAGQAYDYAAAARRIRSPPSPRAEAGRPAARDAAALRTPTLCVVGRGVRDREAEVSRDEGEERREERRRAAAASPAPFLTTHRPATTLGWERRAQYRQFDADFRQHASLLQRRDERRRDVSQASLRRRMRARYEAALLRGEPHATRKLRRFLRAHHDAECRRRGRFGDRCAPAPAAAPPDASLAQAVVDLLRTRGSGALPEGAPAGVDPGALAPTPDPQAIGVCPPELGD